jgi:hypothetical protein
VWVQLIARILHGVAPTEGCTCAQVRACMMSAQANVCVDRVHIQFDECGRVTGQHQARGAHRYGWSRLNERAEARARQRVRCVYFESHNDTPGAHTSAARVRERHISAQNGKQSTSGPFTDHPLRGYETQRTPGHALTFARPRKMCAKPMDPHIKGGPCRRSAAIIPRADRVPSSFG